MVQPGHVMPDIAEPCGAVLDESILQAAVQLSFPEAGIEYRPFSETEGSGGVRRRELILWDARGERRMACCDVAGGHGQSHVLQAHRR